MTITPVTLIAIHAEARLVYDDHFQALSHQHLLELSSHCRFATAGLSRNDQQRHGFDFTIRLVSILLRLITPFSFGLEKFLVELLEADSQRQSRQMIKVCSSQLTSLPGF